MAALLCELRKITKDSLPPLTQANLDMLAATTKRLADTSIIQGIAFNAQGHENYQLLQDRVKKMTQEAVQAKRQGGLDDFFLADLRLLCVDISVFHHRLGFTIVYPYIVSFFTKAGGPTYAIL
ncbi:hypothetical protein H0H81_012683 [Sphagnurus paluster]|uniref:Uncharacterized protein n=1 Tax=Sphagnurus paluster TaxID=117069 RepID=A0A9P7K3D0_9AGAR|nr:hypothetical protein H0H81_012683 [Sphagnurus paluster]